jgi:hypothetical protein
MSLHFLLQSNLVNEEDQAPYVSALEATQAAHPGAMSWSYVKLIPFAGTIEPEADYGPRVFPIGSTSMLAASQRYGWTPGVIFDPLTFRFEAWRDHWGAANLINGDAKVTRFGDAGVKIQTSEDRVFIRPCEDLKAFTGCVVTGKELDAWIGRVWKGSQSTQDSPLLTMHTSVVVASVKTITREWRTWIVDGELVAFSQYAEHGKRVRRRFTPLEVRTFAQQAAHWWQPADAFVLDIGEVDGKLGIVEVNTLNSSGIYSADMAAVYSALVRLYA